MLNSLIVRASSGALAIAFLSSPIGASTVLSTTGMKAPMVSPTSPAASGKRYLNTPNGVVPLIGAAGCGGSGSASFVGGGTSNYAGGYASGIVSGASNAACDQYSIVGAGYDDVVGGSDSGLSYNSFIATGQFNGITGSADSQIGGGWYNVISNPPNATYYNANLSMIGAGGHNVIEAPDSFIGAGTYNTILSPSFVVSNATNSFIGGGYGNSIDADFAVVGGGYSNATNGEWSTIAGGYLNKISPTSTQAFIGGGYNNSLSGRDSMIVGGSDNLVAGDHAFAAGNHAIAPYSGDFVWSDYASPNTTGIAATGPDQFVVRATGGYYFYSSISGAGVRLAPGSGAWSNLSDRNAKHDIQEVNDEQVLTKLAAMPVSTWAYNSEGTVRHLGPMAQDFKAAFNLGEDDTSISTIDEEGVALAAIKALKTENDAKDRQISELRDAHRDDQSRLSRLEARLDALEAQAH